MMGSLVDLIWLAAQFMKSIFVWVGVLGLPGYSFDPLDPFVLAL